MLSLLLRRPVDEEEGRQVARKLIEEITNRGSPFTYRYLDPLTDGRKN